MAVQCRPPAPGAVLETPPARKSAWLKASSSPASQQRWRTTLEMTSGSRLSLDSAIAGTVPIAQLSHAESCSANCCPDSFRSAQPLQAAPQRKVAAAHQLDSDQLLRSCCPAARWRHTCMAIGRRLGEFMPRRSKIAAHCLANICTGGEPGSTLPQDGARRMQAVAFAASATPYCSRQASKVCRWPYCLSYLAAPHFHTKHACQFSYLHGHSIHVSMCVLCARKEVSCILLFCR